MTFGVGNVLATTVRVWGRNLPRFFLLAVICHVPIIAWNILLSIDAFGSFVTEKIYWPLMKLHPALGPEVVSGAWIPYAVLGAAIATCTVGALRDERISIWRGFVLALRRMPWIVGVALVTRIATYGVSLGIAIARSEEGRYYIQRSLFESVLTELVWIALMSLFLVAIPVANVERRGVLATIRRTFALGRGERIKVFAIKLVHTALLWGIYWGTSWVLLFSSDTAADYGKRFMIYAFVRFGVEVVFLASLADVLAAVIYERLRASKEGATPTQLQTVFD